MFQKASVVCITGGTPTYAVFTTEDPTTPISFYFMYMQLGDFCVCKGPPTVQLMRILRNA